MLSLYSFGICYIAHLYYIKKIDSNTYQYQKSYGATNLGTMPDTMGRNSRVSTKHDLICDKDDDERLNRMFL